MPSLSVAVVSDLTPDERRRQVAAILALGVVRHRNLAQLAEVGQVSQSPGAGLELVSETRLSVSHGLANVARDQDCEVNDERNA